MKPKLRFVAIALVMMMFTCLPSVIAHPGADLSPHDNRQSHVIPANRTLQLLSDRLAGGTGGAEKVGGGFKGKSLTGLAQAQEDPYTLLQVGHDLQCSQSWEASVEVYQQVRDIFQSYRPEQYSPSDAYTIQQELYVLSSMAQTLIQAQQFDQAEKVLQEAITLLDTVFATPAAPFLDDDAAFDEEVRDFTDFFTSPVSSTNLYLMMQRVLIAQGKTDTALVAIERGRTQALEELWVTKQIGTRPAPASLEGLQAIARSHDATLVTYSFDTFLDNCEPGLQIPPQLLTWVIQPSGEIHFQAQPIEFSVLASSPNDLQTLLQDTRIALGARGLGVVPRAPGDNSTSSIEETPYLQSLHALLIDPIAAYLSQDPDDHVIFIPDFLLFMVPFAALQDADGSYLIEKHTLLTAPSIQSLALTERSRQQALEAPVNPLVVGNPTYIPVEFWGQAPLYLPPLPAAEQEAIAVAELLNTEPLIGDQASTVAILQRLNSASLIHLATHGFLEGNSFGDLPGSIAVASTTGGELTPPTEIPGLGVVGFLDTGLINTYDILKFRLRAELVVLSACNTGGGDLTGDGINGFSRAFIAAGVPSVIVSQWSVPDVPTQELMQVFYETWLNGNDKAQALRTAMLMTKENYPAPINWAAFTLIGEA